MTVFVAAFAGLAAGYWAGHAHARWIVRTELRGLAKRVGEYTNVSKPW